MPFMPSAIQLTFHHLGTPAIIYWYTAVSLCACVCVLSVFQSERERSPQLIVAGCSSLPRSNIRPCRHLRPVVWALGSGTCLATGPDYFLHSPELNPVHAINQLHAVWAQLNPTVNPVHKELRYRCYKYLRNLRQHPPAPASQDNVKQ